MFVGGKNVLSFKDFQSVRLTIAILIRFPSNLYKSIAKMTLDETNK